MFPVLLTIGNYPVSSFGLFLVLGIFFGAFSVWRIARSFDFDAERVLDIIFLTVGTGFVFARAAFVLINLSVFDTFSKIFFVNRYPGLSFWGGFLGGVIALWWLSKRNRTPFLQAADIAVIGFFIAGFFVEIGCLLGACGVGIPTTSVFSVDQAGAIGKRFPVQLFEALLFLGIFIILWRKILRFHVQGSFLSRGLIFLGLIKLVADFYKTPGQVVRIGAAAMRPELMFTVLTILAGFYFHYKVHKRTPLQDLGTFVKFFGSRGMQKSAMTKFGRWWYNQKANLTVRLGKGVKRLLKMLNIRSNPDRFSNGSK